MNKKYLEEILADLAAGKVSVESASHKLKHIFFEDKGFAHVDHHRSLRKGFPEVIYGQGKTNAQIIAIMESMLEQDDVVLVTRLDKKYAPEILEKFPDASYDGQARMLIMEKKPVEKTGRGQIVIVSAGTSDLPVASEALVTARAMGNDATAIHDVGVAGLHRLFAHKSVLEKATVLVVVAGMEGALPSVVAGLYAKPIIAVPTSVGYGASFGGVTALLAMLNSCASNIAVVNIDNGFGAGYMASMINRTN